MDAQTKLQTESPEGLRGAEFRGYGSDETLDIESMAGFHPELATMITPRSFACPPIRRRRLWERVLMAVVSMRFVMAKIWKRVGGLVAPFQEELYADVLTELSEYNTGSRKCLRQEGFIPSIWDPLWIEPEFDAELQTELEAEEEADAEQQTPETKKELARIRAEQSRAQKDLAKAKEAIAVAKATAGDDITSLVNLPPSTLPYLPARLIPMKRDGSGEPIAPPMSLVATIGKMIAQSEVAAHDVATIAIQNAETTEVRHSAATKNGGSPERKVLQPKPIARETIKKMEVQSKAVSNGEITKVQPTAGTKNGGSAEKIELQPEVVASEEITEAQHSAISKNGDSIEELQPKAVAGEITEVQHHVAAKNGDSTEEIDEQPKPAVSEEITEVQQSAVTKNGDSTEETAQPKAVATEEITETKLDDESAVIANKTEKIEVQPKAVTNDEATIESITTEKINAQPKAVANTKETNDITASQTEIAVINEVTEKNMQEIEAIQPKTPVNNGTADRSQPTTMTKMFGNMSASVLTLGNLGINTMVATETKPIDVVTGIKEHELVYLTPRLKRRASRRYSMPARQYTGEPVTIRSPLHAIPSGKDTPVSSKRKLFTMTATPRRVLFKEGNNLSNDCTPGAESSMNKIPEESPNGMVVFGSPTCEVAEEPAHEWRRRESLRHVRRSEQWSPIVKRTLHGGVTKRGRKSMGAELLTGLLTAKAKASARRHTLQPFSVPGESADMSIASDAENAAGASMVEKETVVPGTPSPSKQASSAAQTTAKSGASPLVVDVRSNLDIFGVIPRVFPAPAVPANKVDDVASDSSTTGEQLLALADVTEPAGSDERQSSSVELTEPAELAEPAEPAKPTELTEPAAPAEPVQLEEPEEMDEFEDLQEAEDAEALGFTQVMEPMDFIGSMGPGELDRFFGTGIGTDPDIAAIRTARTGEDETLNFVLKEYAAAKFGTGEMDSGIQEQLPFLLLGVDLDEMLSDRVDGGTPRKMPHSTTRDVSHNSDATGQQGTSLVPDGTLAEGEPIASPLMNRDADETAPNSLWHHESSCFYTPLSARGDTLSMSQILGTTPTPANRKRRFIDEDNYDDSDEECAETDKASGDATVPTSVASTGPTEATDDHLPAEEAEEAGESDKEMLRKFVSRVKADKTAKAAAAAAASKQPSRLRHKRRSGSTGSTGSTGSVSGSPSSKNDKENAFGPASTTTSPTKGRVPFAKKDHNASPSPPKKRKGELGTALAAGPEGEKSPAPKAHRPKEQLLSAPALEDNSPPRPKRRRKKMEADTGGIFNPAFVRTSGPGVGKTTATAVPAEVPATTAVTAAAAAATTDVTAAAAADEDADSTAAASAAPAPTPGSPAPVLRRSKRAAAAAAAAAVLTSSTSAGTLSHIPVRLPGSLSLHDSDDEDGPLLQLPGERNTAAITRVNTRKNKRGAEHPVTVLARQKVATIAKKRGQKPVSDDMTTAETDKKKEASKKAKSVRWAEVLVSVHEKETRSKHRKEKEEKEKVTKAKEISHVDEAVDGPANEAVGEVEDVEGGATDGVSTPTPVLATEDSEVEQSPLDMKPIASRTRASRASRLKQPTPRKAISAAAAKAVTAKTTSTKTEKTSTNTMTSKTNKTTAPTRARKSPAPGAMSKPVAAATRKTAPRTATRHTKDLSDGVNGNGTPAPKRRGRA